MKKLSRCLVVAISLALTSSGFAAFENFTISLSGAQEVGGGGPGGGSGTLTLDTTANTVTFNNIAYGGLATVSIGAHIHGPAGPGVNANILYDLSPTFTTLGATSGTISGVLTLAPVFSGTNSVSVAQQVTELESGQWYINVHSTSFPNGEIRGQVVQAVPEPAVLALFGLGAAFLWARRRR